MKKIVLLLAIMMAIFLNARASSIFSDSFNYADGSIVANSGGIWFQNSGTAGSCLVSNQTLIVSTSRTEDIAHQFSSVYMTNGPTVALYSSFTLKATGLPTAAGTYFTHFTGTNVFGLSGFRARVWAATTNNSTLSAAPAGQFYLYIVNSTGSTTNGGQWTTALSTNITYTIVTKYVLANGSSTLWVNPNTEADTSVTDPQPVPYDFGPAGQVTNGPVNVSAYSFRQATGEGTMLINDLKVGTAFSDVAGANTAPTISPIPNQSTPANTAVGPINFIIGDAESPASSLILSNASSDTALIPTANIIFGGSDENRTVTITPASGQQGSANITIYVSDGVNVSSTTFKLTVGAPTISEIPNQITYSNLPVSGIAFTVGDAEGDSLTFSNASSNPTLLPANNIIITGSGTNRTVTLIPVTDQTGVSTVTFYLSDGFNTTSTSFVLSVSPRYGVIFADNFSYTPDDFLVPDALYGAAYGGIGNPTLWGHSSGTNYDLLVVNESAQLSGNLSEDLAGTLANAPIAANSGVVLYASFSITFSNLPTPVGDYFAHFKDTVTGTTFRDKLYASKTNAATGYFRLGVANAANNFSVQFPLDLATNQTYFVVTRYNSGTGESVLWVNPTSANSPSVSALDTTTAAIVGAFGLRQADAIGTSYMDNLIVGTSYSDVAPTVVVPIPLNIHSSGGVITLTWSDASFSLQSSSSVSGPYTTIAGAASGFTTNTSNSQIFFRLSNP
ncbi:MAG: hypothetical protein WDN00_04435 [Limisphaerales bacterium]